LSDKTKITAGWICLAFVIFHTANILTVSLPDSIIPPRIRTFSDGYTSEIFAQRWDLFAPCPQVDAKIEVRFVFDSDTTEWIRPLEQAARYHSIWRMTHHGDLALDESNLLYWVQVDIWEKHLPLNGYLTPEEVYRYKQGYSYTKIGYFLKGASHYLFGKSPDAALGRCSLENVVTGEINRFQFPEYKW